MLEYHSFRPRKKTPFRKSFAILSICVIFFLIQHEIVTIRVEQHQESLQSSSQTGSFTQLMNNNTNLTDLLLQMLGKSSMNTTVTLDSLVNSFSVVDIVNTLWKNFRAEENTIAQRVAGSSVLTVRPRTIQTIGICYTQLRNGGIAKVISLHIPMFLRLGYKVVLLTDSIQKEEFSIPTDSIRRIILPGQYEKGRAIALINAIRTSQIDLMIYHDHVAPRILFDLIVIKAQHIPVIINRHGTIVNCILQHDKRAKTYHLIYKIADKLIVLCHMEEGYMRMMGVDALYLPNPVQFLEGWNSSSLERKEDIIIWVGRLCRRDKNYMAALTIMQKVVELHPSAQLYILGRESDKGSGDNVMNFIKKNQLDENIHWVNHVTDIASWYRKAKVHLVTSIFEAFPMSVLESKSFGVPLVLYQLPYLELLKDGRGYISVPQNDVNGAARSVEAVLKNETLWTKLALEARLSIEPFIKFDLEHAWNNVVKEQETLKTLQESCVSQSDIRVMMETLYSQFHC